MPTATSAFPETLNSSRTTAASFFSQRPDEKRLAIREDRAQEGGESPQKKVFLLLSDLLPDLDKFPCHLLPTCLDSSLLSAEAELGGALLEGSR